MSNSHKIPVVLMRGGTSKGLVINKMDLPEDYTKRDDIIVQVFGSSHESQIDGVGGGTAVTSKLAIVEKSGEEGIDVNYTFGQVSLSNEKIDYQPTCGNISAAVGLYAVEENFVNLKNGITTVVIYNTNTKKIIEVEVPTQDGKPNYKGDYEIAGVTGLYPRINVNFLDSGGAITGKLLPTGNPKDEIILDNGQKVNVSVVDSANTLVFVNADDVGIQGDEIGDSFNQPELLNLLEEIRVKAGRKIGLIGMNETVSPLTHALPKLSVIAHPSNYTSSKNEMITEGEIDILGRYVAMGKLHPAYAVSGGIAAATASQIDGTIINDIFSSSPGETVRIGHPSGIIEAEAIVVNKNGELTVERAAIGRSARRIMEGEVLLNNFGTRV